MTQKATPGWPKRQTREDPDLADAVQAAHTADPAALTSIDIDDDVAATADAEGDIATVAALTDNGGGAAADGTIAAITLTEPANLAAQTTINNQLADAVKELSTKINAIKAAYDINFSTLAAQYNALRADVAAVRTQLVALLAARATALEEASS
jgi:hypothetical protein